MHHLYKYILCNHQVYLTTEKLTHSSNVFSSSYFDLKGWIMTVHMNPLLLCFACVTIKWYWCWLTLLFYHFMAAMCLAPLHSMVYAGAAFVVLENSGTRCKTISFGRSLMEDSFLMGRLCRFMVAKYPGHGSQEPFRYNGLAFTRSFSSTAAAGSRGSSNSNSSRRRSEFFCGSLLMPFVLYIDGYWQADVIWYNIPPVMAINPCAPATVSILTLLLAHQYLEMHFSIAKMSEE